MTRDPFRLSDLAMEVDGMARYPWDGSGYDPITANVNPDRHARIRVKHFAYAERRLGLLDYSDDDRQQPLIPFEDAMRQLEALWAAELAARNSAWGLT